MEFLCNECCWFGCKDRKQCYEIVSRKNLGEMIPDHKCNSPDAKVGMCLKERFFCQYLCPMGAIFAWLPTLPFSVLDRDRSNCIPKCRACEIKCPVDYQIKRDQKNGGECIHCMQCVDVCPKQNIHLGSGKKLKGNEIIIILLKLVLFIGVCIFAQNL